MLLVWSGLCRMTSFTLYIRKRICDRSITMPIPRVNLLIPRKKWILIVVLLVLFGLTLWD